MKFKIDENLPVEIADFLTRAGHDAVTVGDEALTGQIDNVIVQACQEEERALLTLDLDFADIRSYPPQRHFGLVIIRSKRQDKRSVMAVPVKRCRRRPGPRQGRIPGVRGRRLDAVDQGYGSGTGFYPGPPRK